MIIATCNAVTLVDNASFRKLVNTLDYKFSLPASAKITSLLNEEFTVLTRKFCDFISEGRRFTICLEGWTKKGLTASFLGISVCFFHFKSEKPIHALLNLYLVKHPHTGEQIANCFEKCLKYWNISREKILLVISDNGANMVKGIKLSRMKAQAERDILIELESEVNEEQITDLEDDENMTNSEEWEHVDLIVDVIENVAFRRLGCIAHVIQLVVKLAYDGKYHGLLLKVRGLVRKVRKSSVALEKIINKCGKTVIRDCSTRWNSTYFMVRRFLEIKTSINEVLGDLNIDSLANSEWIMLQDFVNLLELFANETDILQTDALSLSSVIPSILNLECHLEQFGDAKDVAVKMLEDLRRRFAVLLQPNNPNFNPLPCAACLLDPTCAIALLAAKQRVEKIKLIPGNEAQNELNKYFIEIRNSSMCQNALNFWKMRRAVYPHIAPLAEDLIAAPATQAYVERLFSICGLLTNGRRNRMSASLEMRVFLKLNSHLV
ncbi:zinc finger BED domain-containing protein 4-like [Hydra vulgaris]|uniref:zinc finger BED domain-containing protein 4-like n=1 Tax=Hydra vulgaris TaxID=6087 RepID=UPI0032EA5FC4